jgi:hypothetical protein
MPATPRTAQAAARYERRPIKPERLWPLAILLYGLALFGTNSSFTLVDDEVTVFVGATRPAAELMHDYLIGQPQHAHPPLYDLLYHGWLRLTGGNLDQMRIPAIVFFLLGIWFLGLAAKRMAGPRARGAMVLVALFWPYGFHFGRLAAWYSLWFLLAALVTHCYFRLLEAPDVRHWTQFAFAALALVYTNYFGILFVALLMLECALEKRAAFRKYVSGWLGTILLLIIGASPLWRAALATAHESIGSHQTPMSAAAYLFFTGYSLFVSESVAPWFWWLSVPALAGIAVCLAIVLLRGKPRSRRFLLYAIVLLLCLSAFGLLTTKRAIVAAPWLLLALAATAATLEKPVLRRALAIALAAVFAVGWFGVFKRRYYAAPRFLEPWPAVGSEAAQVVRRNDLVIGNHPSFFFYLTDALQNPFLDSPHHLTGVLTYSQSDPRVFQPQSWLDAGAPTRPVVMTVQGVPFRPETGEMEQIQKRLAVQCQLVELRRSFADPGYEWKQKFLPELGQSSWRIEVRSYSCLAAAPGTPRP